MLVTQRRSIASVHIKTLSDHFRFHLISFSCIYIGIVTRLKLIHTCKLTRVQCNNGDFKL